MKTADEFKTALRALVASWYALPDAVSTSDELDGFWDIMSDLDNWVANEGETGCGGPECDGECELCSPEIG